MVACDRPVTLGEQYGGSIPERERHEVRVLIVDDYVDTADAMQMLLVRAGYDVRVAYSGVEAISIASQFKPNLGILDILLPDMNGYELAQKLRATAGGCCLRLIAVSSCSTPDHELAACFDEVARKPIDGAKLQHLLRRFRPR
jgi:CheY-like chemotaxis protein